MPCGAMRVHLLVALLVGLSAVASSSPGAGRDPRAKGAGSSRSRGHHEEPPRCPTYCACYMWRGLRRADCTRRLLNSVDLGLPRSTEVADLSGNLISSLDDGCFQELGLVQLRELSLRDNAIRAVGLRAFSGMRLLGALDLSYNHLQTLFVDTFVGNPELKVLLLSGNNLARLSPSQPLLNAPRLQVLDLSSCQLAHLGPRVFSRLPALASLNLSSNHLIQLQTDTLRPLAQLQLLDVTKNPINCDANTLQVSQQLHDRNVSLSQPCTAAEKTGRLVAAAVPPGPPASSASPGPARSEKILDMDTWLAVRWNHPQDRVEYEGKEDMSADDSNVELEIEEGGCEVYNASLIDTGNPQPFKEVFDHIPSFWASLIGFQVGFIIAMIFSCLCRSCGWSCLRVLCLDKRRERHNHPTTAPMWSYISVTQNQEVSDMAEILPWLTEEIVPDQFETANIPRAETPPPAYHELSWITSHTTDTNNPPCEL